MKDVVGGEWVNQHGSVVKLELGAQGMLSGTFTPGNGLPSRKPVRIIGQWDGGLVSFSASFPEHRSMTSWNGHLVDRDGGPTLELGWLMAVLVDGADTWKGLWTGHDQFTRSSRQPLVTSGTRPSHPTSR